MEMKIRPAIKIIGSPFVGPIRKAKGKFLLYFVSRLPTQIQSQIAKFGGAKYCRKDIDFVSKCFGTRYKFIGSTSQQIAINASSRNIPGHEVFQCFEKLINNRTVAIDIGANIGTYSLGIAACRAKKVYAIEPGPYFSDLSKNIEINFLQNVIIPVKAGIAIEGEYEWIEDSNNPGNAHLVKVGEEFNAFGTATKLTGGRLPTQTFPLDKFVEEHSITELGFVKIDVESMEFEVIMSGVKTIEKFRPIVVVETFRPINDDLESHAVKKIYQFFYERNYRSFCNKNGELKQVELENCEKDTIFIPS